MFIITSKSLQIFSSSLFFKTYMNSRKFPNFLFFKCFVKGQILKKHLKLLEQSISVKTNYNSLEKQNPGNEFAEDIVKWAIQNNITHYSFSKLLKVLKKNGIQGLPITSKTLLMAKEAETKVSKMPPGIYIHFGLKKNLEELVLALTEKNLFNDTNISVSVFVDQVPSLKNFYNGLWVILGSIEGFINNVFFIGAYQGCSKPDNSNLFLSEFVKEAKHLTIAGLEINNVNYNVNIKRLICDTQAKSFVLNLKCMGYSSCIKCNTTGKFQNNKICLAEKSSLKKNEDFEKNEVYHKNKTCLLEIPNFGVVSNVTIDYMHLVCLGVVKKLFSMWLCNDEYWICKNSASDIIENLALVYPCEFYKKPKSINFCKNWLANDFRQFLLYYGPVVLKNNLKKKYYDHFLLLHVACRLLCIEASFENIERGRHLLNEFVENYKKLYNSEQVTYNFHGLYHLADECISHGVLDNFSAFPFEKFLMNLKRTMKANKKKLIFLSILKNSYYKIFQGGLSFPTLNNFKVSRKIKTTEDDKLKVYYEKFSLRNFEIIPNSAADNCVFLKNGKIIQVTNILKKTGKSKEYFIAGKEFISVSNFHTVPFESLNLGMFTVGKPSDAVDTWPVDFIDKKSMKIPVGDEKSVLIGLLDENF